MSGARNDANTRYLKPVNSIDAGIDGPEADGVNVCLRRDLETHRVGLRRRWLLHPHSGPCALEAYGQR
ncbi:MAG: hypothetical protein ACK55I_48235, partial [bacterium]